LNRPSAGSRGDDSPNSQRLALPDYELERLAERVIGTIDRRIIADRERLGRV
jgi:hypothetical protein